MSLICTILLSFNTSFIIFLIFSCFFWDRKSKKNAQNDVVEKLYKDQKRLIKQLDNLRVQFNRLQISSTNAYEKELEKYGLTDRAEALKIIKDCTYRANCVLYELQGGYYSLPEKLKFVTYFNNFEPEFEPIEIPYKNGAIDCTPQEESDEERGE